MTEYLKTKNLFRPPHVCFALSYRCNSGHHCVQVEEGIFMTRAKNYRLSVQLNKAEEEFSKMHLKKIFPLQTCLLHFFLCITVKKNKNVITFIAYAQKTENSQYQYVIKELHSLNNTERKYNIHLKFNETMSNDLKAKPVILFHVYRYIFCLKITFSACLCELNAAFKEYFA